MAPPVWQDDGAAADELRAKLAAQNGSQQQYTDLGQVELDIKIDKKYRVKEID